MKYLVTFLALSCLSQLARADILVCASQKNESLYYSTGQVKVIAEIGNETWLTDIAISTTGSHLLGTRTAQSSGHIKGAYVRFDMDSDAWCNYRLVLPKGFNAQEKTVAYVDAYCEENTNNNIRLNCSIQ